MAGARYAWVTLPKELHAWWLDVGGLGLQDLGIGPTPLAWIGGAAIYPRGEQRSTGWQRRPEDIGLCACLYLLGTEWTQAEVRTCSARLSLHCWGRAEPGPGVTFQDLQDTEKVLLGACPTRPLALDCLGPGSPVLLDAWPRETRPCRFKIH
ncbi:hypothetical protein NDU88_004316 [Pleurodeles waltl]|uniref:Uncharacterized protein n=1 Tax=Pleurodeles waltl TaxID=8319 RepID=A0AAV7V0W2_PLEWA|nr:hypothetical protein NDU88_004316 [Pleurodeles waltl]